MTILTSDGNRSVDFGSASICHSLYSTIVGRIQGAKEKYPLAVSFLENNSCKAKDAAATADQLRILHMQLSTIKADEAIYDINNPGKKAPWSGFIHPSITTCANLYTTEDGHDLITELISLLEYASMEKKDIIPCY